MKTGDCVWLKSGGPAMTVGAVEGHNVLCHWANRHGNYERANFDICVLVEPHQIAYDDRMTEEVRQRPIGNN